jgi:diacylglycerol kinase (ATP)
MSRPFEFTGRIRSFRYAFIGIGTMLKSQHNAWVHAVVTAGVLSAGGIWHINRMEWCVVVLAIMTVWTAEALNTAFEFLADATSPEFHPLIKHAKDVAAGAVLISAMGSVVIGLIIFLPKLLTSIR